MMLKTDNEGYIPFLAIFFLMLILFLKNISVPLQGMHKIRQADTLITSYLYCSESAPFLEPRLGFRGGLEKGVAIGEVPLFSYFASFYCKWTGDWSESFPKALAYLFFVFGCIFYCGSFLGGFNGSIVIRWLIALCVLPITFGYVLIPIPDSTAILFTGAGLFLLRNKKTIVLQAMGLFLFTIGFLVRPYYIFTLPLLFLLERDIRWTALTFLACSVGYLIWYKHMVGFSEIKDYYVTSLHPFTRLWWTLQDSPRAFYLLLRDHFSFFGVVFFVIGFRENKLLACYGLVAWLAIFILRDSAALIHQYYFYPATIFLCYVMLAGFLKFENERAKKNLVSLMLVNCFVTNQHHWHTDSIDYERLRAYVAQNTTKSDRICTEGFEANVGLYYALRTGWSMSNCRGDAANKFVLKSSDF